MSDKSDIPTIWEISDDLWSRIEPILREAWPRKSPRGRQHADWRKCLNGIIYHMRTGCQWNRLPKEFGDDSTVHRWFQRWCESGVMQRIWADLVRECDELQAVHWEWQSADGSMGKARHGGDQVGRNPTDRGKNGSKRSIVVDEQGGPLGVVVDGANRHDAKLLQATLEAMITPPAGRQRPTPATYPTSAGSAKRRWPSGTSIPTASRAGGWSNGPMPGCAAVGRSWSATRKRDGII